MPVSAAIEPSFRASRLLMGCWAWTLLTSGLVMVNPARGDSTPNWGSGTTSTSEAATATKSSAWGNSGAPPPPPNHTRGNKKPGKSTPIPPALAEILARPDNETITLTDGSTTTVREIRKKVDRRGTVINALDTGTPPPGKKWVKIATIRSEQRDNALNASKLLRDAARTEAAVSWTTPAKSFDSGASAQDPAAAWVTPSSGVNKRPQQLKSELAAVATPASPPAPGLSSPRASASAARSSRSSFSQMSNQPAQDMVAQSIQPGIVLVNGHSKNIQFTPGGLYTLIGSGFGNSSGQVDLIAPSLPGGRLALQVTQWSDRKLQAQLAESISGIADQAVTLRVSTRTGTLFTLNVQFFATRQAITLAADDYDLNEAFEPALGNQGDWDNTSAQRGTVLRTKSGNNIGCPNVGKDTLRTKLPAGWSLADASLQTWLPTQGDPNKDFFGDGGDTVVTGRYSMTQIPAGITNQTYEVQWGVLRSHSSRGFSLVQKFSGNDFGWNGDDGCVSAYSIELTLVGPAGTRPF